MNDAWEAKLRATEQIRKLLGVAAGNANQHESEAALNKARALAQKYGISLQSVKPSMPMDGADKLAAARANATRFAGAFKQAYTGTDDEDYTKYEAERKARNASRKEGYTPGEDEY